MPLCSLYGEAARLAPVCQKAKIEPTATSFSHRCLKWLPARPADNEEHHRENREPATATSSFHRHARNQWLRINTAAKLAPRLSPELALVYDTEKQKGHANRASIAVARKLVAYLLAVDRSGREFVVAGEPRAAA
jgi:hypothetical protein